MQWHLEWVYSTINSMISFEFIEQVYGQSHKVNIRVNSIWELNLANEPGGTWYTGKYNWLYIFLT